MEHSRTVLYTLQIRTQEQDHLLPVVPGPLLPLTVAVPSTTSVPRLASAARAVESPFPVPALPMSVPVPVSVPAFAPTVVVLLIPPFRILPVLTVTAILVGLLGGRVGGHGDDEVIPCSVDARAGGRWSGPGVPRVDGLPFELAHALVAEPALWAACVPRVWCREAGR